MTSQSQPQRYYLYRLKGEMMEEIAAIVGVEYAPDRASGMSKTTPSQFNHEHLVALADAFDVPVSRETDYGTEPRERAEIQSDILRTVGYEGVTDASELGGRFTRLHIERIYHALTGEPPNYEPPSEDPDPAEQASKHLSHGLARPDRWSADNPSLHINSVVEADECHHARRTNEFHGDLELVKVSKVDFEWCKTCLSKWGGPDE